MMDNFQCNFCHKSFYIPRYFIRYQNHKTIFSNNQGEIRCPGCQSQDISFISIREICTNIGEYSSQDMEGKKSMLHRRAKRHMKKEEEQRHELDTKFTGKCKDEFY